MSAQEWYILTGLLIAGMLWSGVSLLVHRVLQRRISDWLAILVAVFALVLGWALLLILAGHFLLLDWRGIAHHFQGPLGRILIIVAVVLPALLMGVRLLRAQVARRWSAQSALLVGRFTWYGGLIALLAAVLHEMGFQLSVILGAAGIIGLGVSFAAQTSLSNIISGVFLLSERHFSLNDLIEVDGQMGFVIAIDLLSVKVRTFDNRLVRIPNEQLLKSRVTNITHYPIRRITIKLSVAYREDPTHVRSVLKRIAESNPLVLDEPEPLIVFDAFGDSGLEWVFGVWTTKEDYLRVKNSIMDDVKRTFDEEEIEIPFPHLSLYAGSRSEALPIRLIKTDD